MESKLASLLSELELAIRREQIRKPCKPTASARKPSKLTTREQEAHKAYTKLRISEQEYA